MLRIFMVLFVSLCVGLLHAQDELPDPGDLPEVSAEDDDGDATPDDGSTREDSDDEDPTLNATDELRIRRLSEASGRTEAEIRAMRSGGGEDGDGTRRGWGVIVKELGLHPGVLGKGTGDKFVPEKDDADDADDDSADGDEDDADDVGDGGDETRDVRLDLPEMSKGARESVDTARERAQIRKSERKGTGDTIRESKSNKHTEREERRNGQDQKDRTEREQTREKPNQKEKPDQREKPDNGNGSNSGSNRGQGKDK